MTGDGDGADVGATDLFFSLAAVLIILLSVASQSLRTVVREEAETDTAKMAASAERESVWLVLAQEDGLILHRPGAMPAAVGLDEILSGAMERWAQEAKGPIWVVIEEGATDSAFLLETSLARAAVQDMRRVRLPGPCVKPRLVAGGMICDG
ncbi:MAG: hypothetical protein O9272_16795 [Brevundimonas sp.]|nr:hypothetical protein [Brevundimonas sp.]